jgi:hypothetical protein
MSCVWTDRETADRLHTANRTVQPSQPQHLRRFFARLLAREFVIPDSLCVGPLHGLTDLQNQRLVEVATDNLHADGKVRLGRVLAYRD